MNDVMAGYIKEQEEADKNREDEIVGEYDINNDDDYANEFQGDASDFADDGDNKLGSKQIPPWQRF